VNVEVYPNILETPPRSPGRERGRVNEINVRRKFSDLAI
jgi:hypothetical protein